MFSLILLSFECVKKSIRFAHERQMTGGFLEDLVFYIRNFRQENK